MDVAVLIYGILERSNREYNNINTMLNQSKTTFLLVMKVGEKNILGLNIEEWEFKNNYEDIYFLLHCLYNAKTELYDRTLTDIRSRYDPTEAFIDGWNRSRSNWYSKKLYDKCVKCIELKTRGHFVHRHWKECVWKYEGLSAQGWINLYQQLIKENKYDSWIMEYIETGE